MENVVLNEVKKELNWKERIIVKLFTKTFAKVYNIARIKIVNKLIWVNACNNYILINEGVIVTSIDYKNNLCL